MSWVMFSPRGSRSGRVWTEVAETGKPARWVARCVGLMSDVKLKGGGSTAREGGKTLGDRVVEGRRRRFESGRGRLVQYKYILASASDSEHRRFTLSPLSSARSSLHPRLKNASASVGPCVKSLHVMLTAVLYVSMRLCYNPLLQTTYRLSPNNPLHRLHPSSTIPSA